MTRQEFDAIVQKGFLYLDGATGSNLYRAGMPRGTSTELWILEHPQVLMDLQKAYVEAGSMAVYAPTFGANRAALSSCGMEAEVSELNKRLVELSQKAVGQQALIIGDLSPTGKILQSQGGETSLDEVFEIYREQIKSLTEAGVDYIGAETMLSVEESMVALDAAQSVCSLPVTCTLTLEADGNALYGGSAVEAVETLGSMGAAAVGVNCSVGPDQMENMITNMKKVAQVPIIAKPNAGLPFIDDTGNAIYSMGPVEFAHSMKKLTEAGASIVGGCCGTTPEYIRKLRLILEGKMI